VTEITFHVGVRDKETYACRLIRKVSASGARVVVVSESVMRDLLDQSLWTVAPHEFLPHCRADSTPDIKAVTPIILAVPGDDSPLPHHEVMVNLTGEVPPGFGSFQRLNEIIGLDAFEIQAGRERYKSYKSRGYALKVFDNAAAGTG
jgi:DNA polymerase-3 subunit chi